MKRSLSIAACAAFAGFVLMGQSVTTDLGSLVTQNVNNNIVSPAGSDLVPLYRGQNGVSNFTTFTLWKAAASLLGQSPAGGFTLSPRNISTCGGNPSMVAYTAQTPVNTEVYIAEVMVPANVTVTGVAVFNSATISGNMKVGLANSAGAIVATSASTAMSGTTQYQLVPFTGTYAAVGPATYYVTVFYDNNTVRPNTLTQGSCGVAKQVTQVYATGFTTITAPTTFTTALGPVANLY
jgi:hypothetical protein